MELWRAEPGDVVRLPASCWPRTVLVTDADAVHGQAEFVRLSWEDDDEGARGSTVLPDALEVDLLFTERADKQCFVTPAFAET